MNVSQSTEVAHGSYGTDPWATSANSSLAVKYPLLERAFLSSPLTHGGRKPRARSLG